ncbi:hypothetical protein ACRQ1B_28910 [Rhizobium panacihumi]|uniref:hypothetical protein n=1 Tax=Rhizobium panacihumi TaxID=2008450 RepID=UPI003D7BC291
MTVKIKLLVSRVGPTVNDAPGDEIEVDEDTAIAMCETASPPQAIRVGKGSGPEKAVPPRPTAPAVTKPQKTARPKPEKAVR